MCIMKKLLLIGITIIAFSFQTKAQNLEKSLLWEISGNGLEKPSYLFGTIHLTCDATIDESIKSALDNTSLLVLEIDMDDPNMQGEMMKGLYMKEGKTIKDFLNEDEYKIIGDFLKENIGMSIEMVGNIKPFFITSMLYPKLLDCNVQSFEMELIKIAHEQEEEVLGLETVSEQLLIFDEIPYNDQAIDLLRSAKDNLAYDKESFKNMMQAYNNKDIEGLSELINNDLNLTTTKHKDKFLINRNKNWISKIEAFSKEQATFFGVGAGHLPGKDGVINLLRKNGYTVKAVF